jgi:hypothetical protein
MQFLADVHRSDSALLQYTSAQLKMFSRVNSFSKFYIFYFCLGGRFAYDRPVDCGSYLLFVKYHEVHGAQIFKRTHLARKLATLF